MCVFCKAASIVLDYLWEDPGVRSDFGEYGVDLAALGPLTHEVFVPAYRKFKENLDVAALSMLDAQVIQDILEPHYDKKTFREAWDEWGDSTRSGFVREQSEVKLAQLLMHFYADDLFEAYKSAYVAYRARNGQKT
jgi:hypothetical protein